MIWWWELGYKGVWTPDSVIKFGCEVHIGSMHEEKDSNISEGSLITWCIFYYLQFGQMVECSFKN